MPEGRQRGREEGRSWRIGGAEETIFKVGDQPLEVVGEFKYMGRVLEKSYDDWPAL